MFSGFECFWIFQTVSAEENRIIDNLIDEGSKSAGDFCYPDVHSKSTALNKQAGSLYF